MAAKREEVHDRILQLIGEGRDDDEIAAATGVSKARILELRDEADVEPIASKPLAGRALAAARTYVKVQLSEDAARVRKQESANDRARGKR